jgi:cobalamin biosynthetic protein CobC
VPARAGIVAAPGTQILIDLLPLALPDLVRAGPVAVLGPTYAEHAQAWRKAGADVVEAVTLDDAAKAASLVLVNPNNPDGRCLPAGELAALAARCAGRGGMLIVDEAFCDFTPDASLLPALAEATLVLRSFGKTYGLAGVRLGFAIGEAGPVAALQAAMGPWAVAGPALAIGAQALADGQWRAQAGATRAADAGRLDGLLAPLGRIVGGTTLFRLLATPAAPALFAHLGRHGIYIRRFQNDATWLRFGLPGDAAGWERLEAALSRFRPGGG